MSRSAGRPGIVAALPGEARAFLGRALGATDGIAQEAKALFVVSGIGAERAAEAAQRLLDTGARALASIGIAGGLDPALDAGALLVPRRVLAADGTPLAADTGWSERFLGELADRGVRSAARGDLVLAHRALGDAAQKRAAFETTGAVAVDMESAAVAAVAARAGVPFLCVRAVSDPVDLPIPPAAMRAVGADGRSRRAALLAALARDPRQLPGVLRLRRAWFAAVATLELVAAHGGRDLAWTERA